MYGLVLEGGGARGAYHVGAYEALKELNVQIGGISGTSIGALNAAMLVQGDIQLLKEIWINTKSSDLFDFDEKAIKDLKTFNLAEINVPYLLNISKEILNNKGLDTSKIRALLETYIDEDKIRCSDLDYGIVTVNLTDKRSLELLKQEIPYGKMIDYILASANYPAFKSEEVDGKKYIDGGFADNLPIGVLAKKGYIDFIAVRTLSFGLIKKRKYKNLNITTVQPVESLGAVLDFNCDHSLKNMKLGYFDTMKVFKSLRGYKYYCEPFEENYLRILINIFQDDKIIKVGKILGYEDMPVHRMLFERIMPRLEYVLDMRGNYDYEDIMLRMFEKIAEKYDEVERFNIYSSYDFYAEVLKTFKSKPIGVMQVPLFIKRNKILAQAVKDNLIVEIFAELFI
ncbi:MAG: patatin [Bacillota bacterium]|nr:patatin [Bacillota bacterium]